MSKIFLTSDTHFGHSKDFLYSPRGFPSIQEHDEAIIANWNSVVGPDDIVYHLGDVMLGDNEHGMECLRRLNGNIKIVSGNHDTDARWASYATLPNVDLLGWAYMLKYRKYHFYLSHYPTITSNYDYDKPLGAKVINLCGHSHTTDPFADSDKGLIYHCEMDAHNCYPVLLDNIVEMMKEENQKCISVMRGQRRLVPDILEDKEFRELLKKGCDYHITDDSSQIYIIPTGNDKPVKVVFET